MSAELAAAGTTPQTGLLDLERELVCSVHAYLLLKSVEYADALRYVQKPSTNLSPSSTASTPSAALA
jgi:hypothetical protein